MCNPVALAIVGSTVASGVYQKYQSDQQNARVEARMKRAEEKAKAEKTAMNRNLDAAENTPLLLTNRGRPGSRGMSQLKIPKQGTSGYSSLGMGGTGGTGLNIPGG